MTTNFFHDATVLLKRSLRHILRSPDTIIATAITPIAMLLLFVYVFGILRRRLSCGRLSDTRVTAVTTFARHRRPPVDHRSTSCASEALAADRRGYHRLPSG